MKQNKERYDPTEVEPRWIAAWEREHIFRFDIGPPGKGHPHREITYSVDTPPPTVSGEIHIGHIFSYVQADIVIRYHRMKGEVVYYPFGFDDNGLPTERLVEKMKNVKAHDLGREEFRRLCLEVSRDVEKEFKSLWQQVALSVDWEENYSTIDTRCRRVSQHSFIDLYCKGLVYRKEAHTLWCINCQTAIAQAEVEDKELEGDFNDVVFPLESGGEVIIATTRPELLPACVAVLVNPDDERYRGLPGRKAKVPIFGQSVPILTDYKVNPEKGSGVVMCCTFGDITDVDWWERFGLPLRITIRQDGRLNEFAGEFGGLRIREGKEKIKDALRRTGYLRKEEKITHTVNTHERCGTPIEILVSKQWFTRILEHKDELIAQADKIKWYPENMKVRYQHWVQNLNWDWCISRQRYFGVPFPVWYCKRCEKEVVADESLLPVDPLETSYVGTCECGSTEFIPEADVMDTWATSSTTPLINADWPQDKEREESLYPMSLRPQAHDIIRTWAFYTIVKSLYNTGKIPWRDIMISGHSLDPQRRKMSKSRGNVVTPKDLLEKHSADAIRYWTSSARLGTDTLFSEEVLAAGKRLITKIYNASRFTLSHLRGYNPEVIPNELFPVDKWILANLIETAAKATQAFEEYEFNAARLEIEPFFWHKFCDNYLELCKERAYGTDEKGKLSTQFTLYHTLLSLLKLFAPYLPFATEEIYAGYFRDREGTRSIHLSNWPVPETLPELVRETRRDEKGIRMGENAVEVLAAVRKVKSDFKISIKKPIDRLLVSGNPEDLELLKKAEFDLKNTANFQEIFYVGTETLDQHNQGYLEKTALLASGFNDESILLSPQGRFIVHVLFKEMIPSRWTKSEE